MDGAFLEVRDLKRSFPLDGGEQQVLKGISLTIEKGSFTVIMGASGSGKSTLLYSLSGMDRPTSGQILFEGTDIAKFSTDQMALFRRRHCGFVFQQICLVDSLSIMDNVLMPGLLVNENRNRKQLYDRAAKLLNAAGIGEQMFCKFPSQISGGEAQRVGIVRALISRPELLFADEPTGALNSQTGQEVLDIFSDVSRNGQSIIMVTHDFRSALRGNRVLYLRDGLIVDECRLPAYTGEDEDRRKKLADFLASMGW